MEDEGKSEAEIAFEELRSEVTILRRAVEALPDAWKANRPHDYTETLSNMVRGLQLLGDRFKGIQAHPALQMTPQEHRNAILVAGGEVMRSAVDKLDHATAEAKRQQSELAALVGSIRGQDRQFKWLVVTGATALLLGVVMSPVFARLLPFGGPGYVAAFIMNTDRWNAGGALMAAESPKAWAELGAMAEFLKSNQLAIEACREAAAKTKREQRCSVVIPASR